MRRGGICCFVGSGTYALLGTGQAQIVDIRQEDPWGSVIWHLIAEIPCWFAPERGHCRTYLGRSCCRFASAVTTETREA